MSEEERESIREGARVYAAEVVREHLEITEKTRIKATLRQTIAIIASIIIGVAAACTFLNRLLNGQERIEQTMGYMVPQSQFSSWANALDKANRNLPPHGLTVPDTYQYRPEPIRAEPDK
jgi:hypothetical protein